MKKETFIVTIYLLSWMVMIGIVGTILQYNEHAFDSEIAEYILFVTMVFGPIFIALACVKYKIHQQKKEGVQDGNKDEN